MPLGGGRFAAEGVGDCLVGGEFAAAAHLGVEGGLAEGAAGSGGGLVSAYQRAGAEDRSADAAPVRVSGAEQACGPRVLAFERGDPGQDLQSGAGAVRVAQVATQFQAFPGVPFGLSEVG